MLKTFFKKLLLIALFFYVPFQTMAWGVIGHRVVGEIADKYLTTTARTKIAKTTLAIPLAVMKAIFTRLRSAGFTMEC